MSLQTDKAVEDDNSLLEIIAVLPVKDRNIIYLYYFENYTVPEIADILQMNRNTVNSRLQRARNKLKEILVDGDNL